jgi:tetratricopeptide (TPR) repeat protein
VQVREKILACFRWPALEHHFEPLDRLPDDVLAYACPPVEALVLAGIREHFDAPRVEPLLAARADSRGRLRRGAEETALRFQASPAEQRLLREIAPDRTLGALRAASSLGPLHAGQVLAALLVGQALDFAPAQTSAQPAPAADRAVARRPKPLRAAPAAAPAVQPQTPVAEPARRVKPLRPVASSLAKLQRQLARSGVPAPAAASSDERSARIEAERAFRQGIQLLEQSALASAQKAFALACERCGEEPEYRMFEAWAQVLSLKDDAARESARAQTSAWARRVLKRDRDSLRAQTILGQLAVAAGEFDTAERHFRHALRAAPDDRDAQRGLRLVDRRRAEAAAEKRDKPKRR